MILNKGIMGNKIVIKNNKKRKQKLCLECQNCCKYLHFILPPNTERTLIIYYKERGLIVEEIEEGPWQGYYILELYIPCVHLTEDGCNIYDNRPRYCREYDGLNDIAMRKKCMWILLEEKEDGIERRDEEKT
jgi:Fe-S-cluster containining protein